VKSTAFRFRAIALALAGTAGLGVIAFGQSRDAPSRPERPFTVHVFAGAPASLEPGMAPTLSMLDGTDALRKKIRERSKWFQIVPTSEGAEIVVSVFGHRIERTGDTRPVRPDEVEETQESRPETARSEERHYLDAKFSALAVKHVNSVGEGKSLTDAANRLVKELESFCRKNYWELVARRQ